MKRQSASRSRASVASVLSLLVVGALLAVSACGGSDTTASSTPSVTPSPTPTPSTAFEPWPPGTASAAEALAVADKYGARTKAETLATAHLVAADSTLDIWIVDDHFQGADVVDYFTGAPKVLNWSRGTVFATAGAAVVECTVTNVDAAITMRCLVVLTISDGKITHQEVYSNGVDGSQVTRPQPVSVKPGPADDAAPAEAAVTAYYAALAKGDATAAAALYSSQVVFQDTTTTGKAGGAQEVIAWLTKAAAVPNMSMELKSVIAGKGWAVARWVFSGDNSNGVSVGVRGATMFEVRDGKIVRQTIYYNFDESPFR